ncbi:MAG: 5-oxoprolinase/urea amidolyase family protein [Solirubrobacteraceae bacterium]
MNEIEVLAAGTLTTVQDWPGRVGFWEIGVPPSGPMDDRSLRVGNRLVGNPEGAAGLEVTLTGPQLRFHVAATVAVTGAPLTAKLDGVPAPQWAAIEMPAGGTLELGPIRGAGLRAYLAVRGGFVGEPEMGSRSVFAAGMLGGRPLRRGDLLQIGAISSAILPIGESGCDSSPRFDNETTLRVVLGPHGAPDFLTHGGLAELLDTTWLVHHQSDRTGIRLVGPIPEWAREDGGDAGLHPSNILDSAYCIGTVMLAGDMAIVVGPDGPSLGGFVAVAQVIRADQWRLGQLRAGDRVRLDAVDPVHAAGLNAAANAEIAAAPAAPIPVRRRPPAPIFERPRDGRHGVLTYRRAGECAVLVEFGEPVLDLRSRVHAHALREALDAERIDGVRDVTPGVRSLHVQYDPDRLDAHSLVDSLVRLEATLPAPETVVLAGRTVHLPLAWRHREALAAIERYQSSVRADAPWCPDNIDFIRRINGLAAEREVREIVCAASYLVVGLGDVYLGAPVAVPLDPRHRLVTTKYNPARTWTPANAVGIGGAFLCVYGMEGPGGYQLVGRTVPVWHRADDPPWQLRHFDQLRFELVGEDELEALRGESERGEWRPRTEAAEFSLLAHERYLTAHAPAIEAFTTRREAAFAVERRAWAAAAQAAEVAA